MNRTSTMSRPHRTKTWLKYLPYSLIGGSLISITIVISANNSSTSFKTAFLRILTFWKSDDARILYDGDSIPQDSPVKMPISQYLPGQKALFEVTDVSNPNSLHPFYFQGLVQGGYAHVDLSVGSPQDGGRIFKIRGLLLPENANVPLRTGLDAPISSNSFFGPLYMKRL